jgi:hypothetical protein
MSNYVICSYVKSKKVVGIHEYCNFIMQHELQTVEWWTRLDYLHVLIGQKSVAVSPVLSLTVRSS